MSQVLFRRPQGQISKISGHWGLGKDLWRIFVPMRTCVFDKHPGLLFMLYPICMEPPTAGTCNCSPSVPHLLRGWKLWGILHHFSFFPKEKCFLLSCLSVCVPVGCRALSPRMCKLQLGFFYNRQEMQTISRIL